MKTLFLFVLLLSRLTPVFGNDLNWTPGAIAVRCDGGLHLLERWNSTFTGIEPTTPEANGRAALDRITHVHTGIAKKLTEQLALLAKMPGSYELGKAPAIQGVPDRCQSLLISRILTETQTDPRKVYLDSSLLGALPADEADLVDYRTAWSALQPDPYSNESIGIFRSLGKGRPVAGNIKEWSAWQAAVGMKDNVQMNALPYKCDSQTEICRFGYGQYRENSGPYFIYKDLEFLGGTILCPDTLNIYRASETDVENQCSLQGSLTLQNKTPVSNFYGLKNFYPKSAFSFSPSSYSPDALEINSSNSIHARFPLPWSHETEWDFTNVEWNQPTIIRNIRLLKTGRFDIENFASSTFQIDSDSQYKIAFYEKDPNSNSNANAAYVDFADNSGHFQGGGLNLDKVSGVRLNDWPALPVKIGIDVTQATGDISGFVPKGFLSTQCNTFNRIYLRGSQIEFECTSGGFSFPGFPSLGAADGKGWNLYFYNSKWAWFIRNDGILMPAASLPSWSGVFSLGKTAKPLLQYLNESGESKGGTLIASQTTSEFDLFGTPIKGTVTWESKALNSAKEFKYKFSSSYGPITPYNLSIPAFGNVLVTSADGDVVLEGGKPPESFELNLTFYRPTKAMCESGKVITVGGPGSYAVEVSWNQTRGLRVLDRAICK